MTAVGALGSPARPSPGSALRPTERIVPACVLTTVGGGVYRRVMDVRGVLVVTLFGSLALAGGGVVTTLVFRSVDRRASEVGESLPESSDGVAQAATILRGGAWIGALERLAIFAGLVASWPEAIAIVLAVKGLGRYPELRSGEKSAVAERFIIGTFVSVLWACGCAGLVAWLRT